MGYCMDQVEKCYQKAEESFEDAYNQEDFDYCDFLTDVMEEVQECAMESNCYGEAYHYCVDHVLPSTLKECPGTSFTCEHSILSAGDIAAITLGCLLFLTLCLFFVYVKRNYTKRDTKEYTPPTPESVPKSNDEVQQEITV